MISPYQYGTPDDASFRKTLYDKYSHNLLLLKNKNNQRMFIHKSVNTFDSYGTGLALLYVLNKTRHLMDNDFIISASNLFMRMIDPNIQERIEIDDIIPVYHTIINDLKTKHKKHIENNILVDDDVPISSSISKEITKSVISISSRSSRSNLPRSLIMSSTPNPCKDGKYYNKKTKRCLKSCKPNQTRNHKLRCVKTPINRKSIPKPLLNNASATGLSKHTIVSPTILNKCKKGKLYNNKTKKCGVEPKPILTNSTCNAINKDLDISFRCIPKCKSGKSRNTNGRCV
jgi:hypothetical protein